MFVAAKRIINGLPVTIQQRRKANSITNINAWAYMVAIALLTAFCPAIDAAPPDCLPDCRFSNFNNENLQGVDFSGADLRWARFVRANLQGAVLTGADLTGAVLLGADLKDALFVDVSLVGSCLIGADFSGALLDGVDFRFADLQLAKLIDVDLTASDLGGANLDETTLIGADLRSVDPSQTDLGTAYLMDPKLPPGYTRRLDHADTRPAMSAEEAAANRRRLMGGD